jgi:two-component system sensor histidine kinase ChiS
MCAFVQLFSKFDNVSTTSKGLCTILFFWLFSQYASAQSIEKGYIDLSNHDFDKDEYVLSGTWQFYWNKLLSPSDFNSEQNPEWIYVPGSWHRQGNYSVLGHATYRINVKVPETQSGLALYFPIINSSAKIWINGELVSETGVVSTDKQIYSPQLIGTLVQLPEKVSRLDIIVQVANYTYFSGGIAGYPRLDKSSALFEYTNRVNGILNFFAGSLIALFIYQLILYFLFHRGKPYLWLALICLGVALRALIVHGGSFLLPNLFPLVPWEYWKKIEFGSVYAITALFPLYVYHLFSEQAPKKPIWIFVGVAALLCGTVLVTPQYVYGRLLEVCHAMLLLAFIYAVYTINKAWRAGSADARVILSGVLASFPFILAEIAKNSRYFPVNIEFMYLVELGVLVFLLFQVYLLASHYAKSYKKLETVNIDLERMVGERTNELVTANTVKDRLLSVVSHDIKSPLNSLQGILSLYNNGSINKDEFGFFIKRLESDLSKTSMLVENILYWTASQLKGVHVNQEKFNVTSLMEENIQLFQTIASIKKIVIQQNIPSGLIIHSDRNILNLVLRNLLSNAIKFSFEGGEINTTVKQLNNSLVIEVKDHGVGIDSETIQSLMNPMTTLSTSGTTHEKGTGLGLALCRDYLQQIEGTLIIKSVKGKGSTFSIELPL